MSSDICFKTISNCSGKGIDDTVSLLQFIFETFHNKKFFFFNLFYLFIYFWLRWVFVAAHRLSLVAAHRLSLVAASGGYSSL